MFKEYLFSEQSKINGLGLFSKIDIPAKSAIVEITGPILKRNENTNINIDTCLQVSEKLYIGSSGDVDDFINHSCNPNCYIVAFGKRAILYSLYFIPAGNELTFDYSTVFTDRFMECSCKNIKCRKIIKGFHELDEDLKENYIKNDMVPSFIKGSIIRG